MNPLIEQFSISDPDGGKIYMDERGNLFLLKNETPPKPFSIGLIYPLPDGRLVYVKYEDERHINRKTNSWSINYEILKRVSFVKYLTRDNTYWIDSERARNCGEFHFKTSGVEAKIYIPVSLWIKRDRVKAKINNK